MAKAGKLIVTVVGAGLLLGALGGHFARPEVLIRSGPEQPWQDRMRERSGENYPDALDTGPRQQDSSRWADSGSRFDPYGYMPPVPEENPDRFWEEPDWPGTYRPEADKYEYDAGYGPDPFPPPEDSEIEDEWSDNYAAVVEWPDDLPRGAADTGSPPVTRSEPVPETPTPEPRAARGDLPAIW